MAAKHHSSEPSANADGDSGVREQLRRKAGRRGQPTKKSRGPSRPAGSAAALIVAHNQARRIAATVRAARAIPGIDFVLVVDDGSADNTQDLARKAGAVVVRHSHVRGRTVAVETGASVIAMRDQPDREPRAILLLQGSLGNYAIGAAPLVQAVTEHVSDLAVALTDSSPRSGGVAAKVARNAIEKASNWTPHQPLSRIRCITRQALEAAMPLSRGAGLEVGMSLDVLNAGFTITEVDFEIRHKSNSPSERSATKRATQYRDVLLAVNARRVRNSVGSTRKRLMRAKAEEK